MRIPWRNEFYFKYLLSYSRTKTTIRNFLRTQISNLYILISNNLVTQAGINSFLIPYPITAITQSSTITITSLALEPFHLILLLLIRVRNSVRLLQNFPSRLTPHILSDL